MKRRLLPILMTLVLVCALPIWAAFVTSGDVTNPLLTTAAASEMALQERINQANAGATITLNSNTEIAAALKITKNLTIDLNGCVLKMTGSGSVLKVSDRATLTIQDSSANGTGTITGGNAEYGGGVYIGGNSSEGHLVMTGGTIRNCTDGSVESSAIYMDPGTMKAHGGTFYGPIVNEAGPGQVTGGTFAVTFDRGDGTKTGPELVGYKGTVSRPPSDPEKSGHTFTGWYLDDEKYNFDTPVTAPLTLTAKWEKVPSSGGYYYYQPTTDTKTDDAKGSPKTADPGVALYAALSLLSLTGLTCTTKKR